ncbi:PREDICTED: basic blue protein-like [Tarenaya hassleriana]|uniref:basic blue protein-like n=1 Tax=Tarenaya hassleriana TaxID=28532 RepID=UPI00053C27CA|nr:PREDICTED: basic blue protein-like [Tarenaya hassleriana]
MENMTRVFIAAMSVCVLLQSQVALSTNYVVGDSSGWFFGVSAWPNGKTFKAGDVLEFKYDVTMHSVVEVGKSDYESCNIPSDATTYNSGDDKITLSNGTSYFVCGFPGHCAAGMKIAITAN